MAESKRQQTDAQKAANLSVKIRALKKSSNEKHISKAHFIRLLLQETTLAPAQIRDLLGKHGIEVTTKNVRDVKQRLPQYEVGKLKPRKKPQKLLSASERLERALAMDWGLPKEPVLSSEQRTHLPAG